MAPVNIRIAKPVVVLVSVLRVMVLANIGAIDQIVLRVSTLPVIFIPNWSLGRTA